MKYLWLASSAIKACHVATVLLLISLSSRSLSAKTNTKTKQPWKNSTERTWKLLTSAASTPICNY